MVKLSRLILFTLIIITGINIYLSAEDLLLWNKLGSDIEIQNSQAGPNGIVIGPVDYRAMEFGHGVHLKDHGNGHIKFPSNCYNKSNGCIECWVTMGVLSSYPAFEAIIFESYNSPNSKFISLKITPNTISALYTGINYSVLAKTVYENASWKANDIIHLAVVYDINHTYDGDKTLSLFVNGIEKAYSTASLEELTAGEFYLCKNPYANTEYFPGYISTLRIWNYAKISFSNFMY